MPMIKGMVKIYNFFIEFLIKVDVTGYLGVWFLQEEAFLKLIQTLKWNK